MPVGSRALTLVARVTGWLIAPVYVAGVSASYFFEHRAGLWNNENQAETLALIAGFGAFAVVGSLLTIKRPTNPVGWIVASVALLVGLFHAGDSYAAYVMVTQHRPDALAV